MKKETKMVDVDDNFSSKIVIHRHKDGGFQRPLRTQRLGVIAKEMSEGSICPPITVAHVGDKFILVDGQHRLEAWKLQNFPLKAMVYAMKSEDEANEAFITMNRERVRVSRTHVIKVSTEDVAVRTREMAEKFKVTNQHVFQLLCGIANVKDPFRADITEDHWKLLLKTLMFWSGQRRWGREDNCFSRPGVLMMVGYFVGKSSSVDSVLRDLSKLDYSNSGKLSKCCGTSFSMQKQMKDIFYRAVADQVL